MIRLSPNFATRLAACLAILGTGCSSHSTLPTSGDALPIHHYFTQAPLTQVFKLSPDGKRLAALEILAPGQGSPEGQPINLTVTDLDSGLKYQTTGFEQTSVGGFAWANNERLLFYTHSELDLLAVNFDGSMPRRLNEANRYVQAIHLLPDMDDTILVARPGRSGQQPNIYELNIVSGRARAVQNAPRTGFPLQWFTTRDGQVMASLSSDGSDLVLLVFDPETQDWSEVRRDRRSKPQLSPVNSPLKGFQGYVIAASDESPGSVELARFDFSEGLPLERLLLNSDAPCCELFSSPLDGQLVSASAGRDQWFRTTYFEDDFRQVAEQVGETLNQRDIRFVSVDRQRTRAVVLATSPLYEPSWYLYSFAQHALQLLEEGDSVVERLAQHRDAARLRALEEQHARFAMGLGLRSLQDQRGVRQVDAVSSRSVNSGSGGN